VYESLAELPVGFFVDEVDNNLQTRRENIMVRQLDSLYIPRWALLSIHMTPHKTDLAGPKVGFCGVERMMLQYLYTVHPIIRTCDESPEQNYTGRSDGSKWPTRLCCEMYVDNEGRREGIRVVQQKNGRCYISQACSSQRGCKIRVMGWQCR
jgi:hypothetical protein